MKIFLFIVIILVSKPALKAINPYWNKALDDKIKEHAKPIIDYLDYCRIWW
tara:strand:+ start:2360 stop:2512 length:153 start_codon:yes stop_codon:yes gene_type:complete